MRQLFLALFIFVGISVSGSAKAETFRADGSIYSKAETSTGDRKGVFVNYAFLNWANYSTGPMNWSSSLAMNGLSAGYRKLRADEAGFDVGANAFFSNQSTNVNVVQGFGNLNYSVGDHFFGYGGLNFTDQPGAGYADTSFSPSLGGQMGVGLHYDGFEFLVGYNLSRFNAEGTYNDESTGARETFRGTYSAGGFMAQAGYLF